MCVDDSLRGWNRFNSVVEDHPEEEYLIRSVVASLWIRARCFHVHTHFLFVRDSLLNFSYERTLSYGRYIIIKNSNYKGNRKQIFHTFTLLLAVVTRLHNLVSHKINT